MSCSLGYVHPDARHISSISGPIESTPFPSFVTRHHHEFIGSGTLTGRALDCQTLVMLQCTLRGPTDFSSKTNIAPAPPRSETTDGPNHVNDTQSLFELPFTYITLFLEIIHDQFQGTLLTNLIWTETATIMMPIGL